MLVHIEFLAGRYLSFKLPALFDIIIEVQELQGQCIVVVPSLEPCELHSCKSWSGRRTCNTEHIIVNISPLLSFTDQGMAHVQCHYLFLFYPNARAHVTNKPPAT